MLDDGLERRDNSLEHFGNVSRADQQVVDLQQNLEAIAFASELLLVRLSGFEIQRVVDGDRNLRGHALHEFDFCFRDALGYVAAKA
jgi:hypothetical protein